MMKSMKMEEAALLKQAFASFDEAAGTLERAYQMLSDRVQELNLELEVSNQALRASLASNEEIKGHLHAILESLTTGVLVTDLNARITTVNRTAETLLELDRDELIGQSLSELLRDWGYAGTAAAGEVLRKQRRLAVSLTDLRGEGDRPIGRVAQFQDVTELKRLEEQVQRQQRLTAMGEMAARLAHEIRSPLGSIELFGSLLRQELAADPGRRQLADHICTAVRAMDHLIGNTLSFVSPRRPRWAPVKLAEVVQEAVLLATPLIESHKVCLRQTPAEAPLIWGDEGMLRQAVLNILLNAVQAMPQGGDLSIECVALDGNVNLRIADTGRGIAAADRPRLFDPFFTTRPDGTGLGLAICHNIMLAHGGAIEVESEIGKGTVFTLVFSQQKGAKGIHGTAPTF
jgi:PAS domain S-box-containing protein